VGAGYKTLRRSDAHAHSASALRAALLHFATRRFGIGRVSTRGAAFSSRAVVVAQAYPEVDKKRGSGGRPVSSAGRPASRQATSIAPAPASAPSIPRCEQGALTMTEPETRAADDATISSAHRSTITVSDLRELVDAAQEILLPFNHDTGWWRGHANAQWRLEPHAFRRHPERPENQFYNETALLGHFVSRAPSRSHRPCPDNDDYFGWLFLAQHYGLPTRLLDWTENPLVAAYFAVLEQPSDNDGCLWALWPTGSNRAFGAADGLVQIRDPNVRKIAESAFRGHRSPSPGEIIALDGQEIDPRMLAQMSRFTLHSNRAPLEQMPESATWLRQFVIPKNAKAKIRAQLSAFGIRRSNLFPDLATWRRS
jgi:hypothetical protein